MARVHLTTVDDPGAQEYACVRDPELVRSRGLFVAEGRLVVQRVLRDPRYVVRSLLLSESAHRALAAALHTLPGDVPIYIAPVGEFARITGFNVHRGCLALVERPSRVPVEDLLAGARTVVVLEAIANPDNMGGVFRNVLTLGGDAVLLGPACTDPFYRKTIRTSMGASLAVPFSSLNDWPSDLQGLRSHGFTIIALTPHESAMTIDDFLAGGRPERTAILVGTEGSGLSEAAQLAAACAVRIPMRSGVDSLNLVVAVGVVLHRLGLVDC
jgi:tRNA G18 (ribose-2'-O)-methylase SpoU